jgi:hypothetical protein
MAYATKAQLKALIGITQTTDDDLLDDLLTRAQEMIESLTSRTFEASGDTTRTLDAVEDVEGATLYLPNDLCQITSVTNGDSATVTGSSYVTEPRGATPYYALKLKGSSGVGWTYSTHPEGAISIVGRWAYSVTAPADIVQATLRLAAWMYKQRDTMGDGSATTIQNGITVVPTAIPSDVKTMLAPYRRIV